MGKSICDFDKICDKLEACEKTMKCDKLNEYICAKNHIGNFCNGNRSLLMNLNAQALDSDYVANFTPVISAAALIATFFLFY